ncbi:MAG: 1-acyl-sn-glycerol-3-phosphate acyltransferase [Candidatus Latescibacterota bacterium]
MTVPAGPEGEVAQTGFRLRRRYWPTHVIRGLLARALYYHRLIVEGAELLPREGPALLLPKHRAYRDIPVEGVVLYRYTGRYANYVMKVGLWGVLELMGGIKIIRPKDLRRLKDREARRAEITRAREANQRTVDYLSWLYGQGEIVVSHPEGQRYRDGMGPLQKEIIEHLLQVERALGRQIPMFPIGFEYESLRRPRARAYCRIGEPLLSGEYPEAKDLVEVLGQRLRALSGLA